MLRCYHSERDPDREGRRNVDGPKSLFRKRRAGPARHNLLTVAGVRYTYRKVLHQSLGGAGHAAALHKDQRERVPGQQASQEVKWQVGSASEAPKAGMGSG